jgi:Sap, sulfolipid-1-addressing protein
VDDVLRIVIYGLFAAASPLALSATIVVLESRRGRLNGIVFALAFLAGASLVVAIVLLVGSVTVPDEGHGTAATVVELLVGLVLIACFPPLRRRALAPAPKTDAAASHPVLDMLRRLTPLNAAVAGVLLGVGGPKRLTITLVAAGSIATAGFTDVEQIALAVVFVVLASVVVWAPVLVYVVAGARAGAWLESMQAWLAARQRTITAWSVLVIGVALAADALARLA